MNTAEVIATEAAGTALILAGAGLAVLRQALRDGWVKVTVSLGTVAPSTRLFPRARERRPTDSAAAADDHAPAAAAEPTLNRREANCVNVLSLFSGIGGLDLGLERSGMTVVGQVEIDPWCRKVLAKHWPEVPRHDDVRTCAEWWGGRPVPDLVAGGFALPARQRRWSQRQAQADPRWLWPAMANVIRGNAAQPGSSSRTCPVCVPEDSPLFDATSLRLGYRTRPGYISACEMGATHPRRRLFTLAHAKSVRCGQGRPRRPDLDAPARAAEQAPVLAHTNGLRPVPAGRGWWDAEPGMARMA